MGSGVYAASARCRRFGLDIDVTPHMLRHTFAVHMLTLLLREQMAWLLEERAGRMSPAYRRLIGDPLLKLQRLMGQPDREYLHLPRSSRRMPGVDRRSGRAMGSGRQRRERSGVKRRGRRATFPTSMRTRRWTESIWRQLPKLTIPGAFAFSSRTVGSDWLT
jgi:hypothetical protein